MSRRLVLVEWEDSFGCASKWENIPEEISSPHVMRCRSVGWLAYDGDDCKVVIPHVGELSDGGPDQGCGDMTIPTCAVTRIVDLVEQPSDRP